MKYQALLEKLPPGCTLHYKGKCLEDKLELALNDPTLAGSEEDGLLLDMVKVSRLLHCTCRAWALVLWMAHVHVTLAPVVGKHVRTAP